MKFDRMPDAEHRDGDRPAMTQAIDALLKLGVEAKRPYNNNHQLKIDPFLSYYPGTGSIMFDSEPPLPERGLEALIRLIRSNTPSPGSSRSD